MLVGLPSDPKVRRVHNERCEKSVEYAMEKIKASPIAPYVRHLYLYGSCARKQQNESSDVDLFLQLAEDFPMEQLKGQTLLLVSEVVPVDPDMPEVELHIAIGDEWRNSGLLYHENVRKDGIDLWTKETLI